MTPLQPRLDRLPEAQRELWPKLSEIGNEFVLYGGTALALQLGGRISVDFDFFSPHPVDARQLLEKYSFLASAVLLQRAKAIATYSLPGGPESVKISFFGTLGFGRVGSPVRFADNGLHAASLLDLAAQVVKGLQVRTEAKDYRDLGLLLKNSIPLHQALGAAAALYPGFNASVSLKALSYFEDVPDVPMDLRRELTAACRDVERIPVVSKEAASLLPESD